MSGIVVAGRHVRFIERISVAGAVIGELSKATSYRLAEADDWPLVGPKSNRYVSMTALLTKYGIPFEVEADDARE